MEDEEAAFHVWLCGALSRVKLEDEAYVGYVESILKEDTYQPDEKKDAVLEFLASSSEEDLTAFGDELMAHWNKIEEAKHAVLQAKKTQEDEQLKAAQALQQKEREEKAKQRAEEHQLSKEERLKRRELLERYGYQIETTDENGDIVLTENLCDVQDADQDVEHNDNVSKIVQESQAQREKAREKHQQKVLREKELLLKDQEKKEKRKRKTEKREKRRL